MLPLRYSKIKVGVLVNNGKAEELSKRDATRWGHFMQKVF